MLIIYVSDYGHTRRAAEAVAEGAERVSGIAVRVLAAEAVERDDLLDADALVLGSPVHMGSMHWQMRRFVDETLSGLWTRDLLVGRVGGVFATGGGLGGAGGGCELAMLSMLAVMAELGMVLVPLPKSSDGFRYGGLHWGPYARCASDELAPATPVAGSTTLFESHGAHVARVASQLSARPDRLAVGGG